jgi:hypothetical protein
MRQRVTTSPEQIRWHRPAFRRQDCTARETSRELIRHAYYRYEFATVAVTHSLFALEHVLAERLATNEPLHDLIQRATDAGLITSGLGVSPTPRCIDPTALLTRLIGGLPFACMTAGSRRVVPSKQATA